MRRLPWAEIVVTVLALTAGVAVYMYAHRHEGALEESKQRGAVIVAALEAHRSRAGSYPLTLEQLVPDYLPEVEPPTWGLRRWRYRRYTAAEVRPADASGLAGGGGDTEYFQLSVAANEQGYPVLYHDFTARRWVLNN